ncbi:MAG: MFS transporter [Candidatus Hydrogenedentota bacterium]
MLPIATVGLVATSPGQTYGISIFNEYFRNALELSNSQMSGAYTAGTLLAAAPMTYVGALMDRFGLRRCITVTVALLGAACIYTSQVTGLFTLLIAFFLLRMLGPGALGLLCANVLAFWFHRRLGMVEGIRYAGIAVALAVVPMLNLWLVQSFGWRWAFAILGIGVCVLMLPLMIPFRNRPEEVGQYRDGIAPSEAGEEDGFVDPHDEYSFTLKQAFKTRAFWIVAAALALWGMLNTGVIFFVAPLATERGLTEADAAQLFPVFAVSLALVQFGGGFLADRIPLNYLLAASCACMAGTFWVVWAMDALWMVYFAGLMMGLSQGLMSAARAPLFPRFFGRDHLGKIRGSVATILVGSSSAGPLIVGVARDSLGTFDMVLALFAFLPLPLVFLSFLATPPARPGQGVT